MNEGLYLKYITSNSIRSLGALTIATMLTVFGGCLAIAGLILAAPCAQATTYYNLTGLNADSTVNAAKDIATINGAIFTSDTTKDVVGTGVLQPFVRIQQNGNGNCKAPCIESGYNTDGTAQFETKDAGGSNWDHSLKLSDVGTTTVNGIVYRNFILDINEANTSADRMLSLDKFKIYLGSVGSLDNYTETPPDGAGPADSLKSKDGTIIATKIFDIDFNAVGANTDSSLGLNYNLNEGSGKGIDLVARIPDSYFQDALAANPNLLNVYLYSSFGATGTIAYKPNGTQTVSSNYNTTPPPAGLLPAGNYAQSAGFEEWATRVGTVPEPMSVSLFLIGFAALGLVRRQRHSPAC